MAKQQTAGRGRQGRHWESPERGGIYLSILLKPSLDPNAVMPLTMLTALAVRDAMQEFLPDAVGLKWPNDIIYHRRKLCGILLESVLEDAEIRQLVVGIGLNVNQMEFGSDLTTKATSIRQISGLRYDPNYITARILEHFALYYQRFIDAGAVFAPFLSSYQASCITLGRAVSVDQGTETFEAVAVGITADGLIELRMEDGSLMRFGSGEVRVRGILE